MHARRLLQSAGLIAIGAAALPAQQVQPQSQGTQSPQAAQSSMPSPASSVTPVFGLMVGSMSIGSASAARSLVGERSYGLQLDAGMLVKRHLYLGVDVGGQFLDDHAQFTQNTTGGEMKSSASVTYLSAIAGLRTGTPRAVPMELALNVGASVTISRRSIDNCVDCQVDKLDIPGGAFVEPTLMLGRLERRGVRLRVSDRLYMTGDGMHSVASIGVDLQPRRR